MKVRSRQEPIQSRSNKELCAEQRGKKLNARRHEREHLRCIPQIRSDLPTGGEDAVPVLFQKVAGNAFKITRLEKCPKQGFGPARRVRSCAHMHPFSGHRRPCHRLSAFARASLSARTPLTWTL